MGKNLQHKDSQIMKKVVFAATPIGDNSHIAIALRNYLKITDIAIVESKNIFEQLCRDNEANVLNIYETKDNIKEILEIIINGLNNNKNILIVSNDGYPTIQDSGTGILHALIKMNIDVDIIPGPSSILQSLFFSGFEGSIGEFYFAGRLKDKNTKEFLNNIKNLSCPIIFICIPFLDKYIDDIAEVFPDREIAVCCDISKPTQKILRGKTTEMKNIISNYRKFPFNFDLVYGWKTNIHMFYSHYTLVISQAK